MVSMRLVSTPMFIEYIFRKLRIMSPAPASSTDRKSTRLNSSHSQISYAVFCLKKKKIISNAIHLFYIHFLFFFLFFSPFHFFFIFFFFFFSFFLFFHFFFFFLFFFCLITFLYFVLLSLQISSLNMTAFTVTDVLSSNVILFTLIFYLYVFFFVFFFFFFLLVSCFSSTSFFFFFNDTATTEIYTLSLHDALPIYAENKLLETLVSYKEKHINVLQEKLKK